MSGQILRGDPDLLPPRVVRELGPDQPRQCPGCEVWHVIGGDVFSYSPPERADVLMFTRFCGACSYRIRHGLGEHLLEAATDAMRAHVWDKATPWPEMRRWR